MYAQHRSTANIPRNYSGNAFRYPPIGQMPEQPEQTIASERSSPAEPLAKEMQTDALYSGTRASPAPVAETVPVSMFGGGHDMLRGITQGIGNEELLLIGLFILLSGNTQEHEGQRSDLLFYLLLLFFCG
ncbi:MAG: hypothetical protein IIX15_04715 [Clostridia bacterium]|nr:hypothetical protein [Clostridia bacterium]